MKWVIRNFILLTILLLLVVWAKPVIADSTNDSNTQTNQTGSNTQITGGYTATTGFAHIAINTNTVSNTKFFSTHFI